SDWGRDGGPDYPSLVWSFGLRAMSGPDAALIRFQQWSAWTGVRITGLHLFSMCDCCPSEVESHRGMACLHTHTYTHTHTHTDTHTHAHTHICEKKIIQTPVGSHRVKYCTHVHMRECTQVRTHTHAHTHTYTRTPTHSLTHSLTHIQTH